MADSITAVNLPAGYQAYASYTDGRWPDFAAVKQRFPQAHLLSITVTSADPAADACDCENGDLTPAQAVAWAKRRIAAGAYRPVIYANAATMAAAVLPGLVAARVAHAAVRLWSAHYGAGEHICGPATCKLVPVAMDGTQWTDTAPGENGTQVDASILADGFFSPPPAPAPAFQEELMPQLRTGHGARDAFAFPSAVAGIAFVSDPSGDGVPQTAVRVALHKSANDWLVDTVTLTPAQPRQVLAVGGGYDGVVFSRLDNGGPVGVAFT